MSGVPDDMRTELVALIVERVRAAFDARSWDIAERLVGLSDEKEAKRVLREEMRRVIVEAGIGVEDDPVAQARLDAAVHEAFSELGRLSDELE